VDFSFDTSLFKNFNFLSPHWRMSMIDTALGNHRSTGVARSDQQDPHPTVFMTKRYGASLAKNITHPIGLGPAGKQSNSPRDAEA
jgi:hypothetical protein